jgi:regulator of sigma E protease
MTILLVILILVGLIITHELGHFIIAKICGVRVDEFGIGYPPRAFRFGKIGDTEYTLNWIPFGGFVRLFGDEGEKPERGRGSFVDAPRYAQALILIAGVTMNALAAWGLFAWALTLGVPRAIDTPTSGIASHMVISDVVPGSPAYVAGITAGDELLAITDANNATVPTLTPDAVSSFISTRGGKEILLTTFHAHATTSVTVRPANAVVPGQAGKPAIGVGLVLVTSSSLPWSTAITTAFGTTVHSFKLVGESLWQIVSGVFDGNSMLDQVVGPVGLVGVVGEAAHTGLAQVIALAAFISINLAIINLLPIPMLDGGRIFILAIETITRRDAPRYIVQILNLIGVVLVVALMITVTYHDIMRLLT